LFSGGVGVDVGVDVGAGVCVGVGVGVGGCVSGASSSFDDGCPAKLRSLSCSEGLAWEDSRLL
jgi:hypothetical protein